MSLLSDTQGSAERMWSLLRLLEACGGRMPRADINRWLGPQFNTDTEFCPREPDTAVAQTVGATDSLEFLSLKDGQCCLELEHVPDDFRDFADTVYHRLCKLPEDHPDHVVLEAYAAMVVLTERYNGTQWLRERPRATVANQDLAEILRREGDTERRFNDTKYTHWVRWIVFLGLGIEPAGLGRTGFYPSVTERLERELRAIAAKLPPTDTHDVGSVLEVLSGRMPYLDRGALFEHLRQRAGLSAMEGRLSRLLSAGLRDLHDDGRIELVAVGDSADMYHLSPEQHPIRAVTGIRFSSLVT